MLFVSMDESYARYARQCGLEIADPDTFGIRRRKRGEGFRFINEQGRSPGRDVTARLKALAIPPAWSDVRCTNKERHHVLVVGTDGDGRRQYIYHPDWENVRNAIKVERLLRFGRALPRIRRAITRDLRRGRVESPDGVAALAARLVDKAAMRPGNEAYALRGHRGVATLARDDVSVAGEEIELNYVGKSGREHEFSVRDPLAAKVMQRLKRSRRKTRRRALSRRLLTYKGHDGEQYALTATKLNQYLAEVASAPVSAKDFRTFIGSTYALELLNDCKNIENEAEREKAVSRAVNAVSERLRNTPAVARSSYIMPTIIEQFESGELGATLFHGPPRKGLSRSETALLRHLEQARKQ